MTAIEHTDTNHHEDLDRPADPTPAADVDDGQALDEARPRRPQGLPPAEQRAAARRAWLAEPTLTGAELAARFGRKERWGREQVAAARRSLDPGTSRRADRHAADLDRHAAPPQRHAARRPAAGARAARPRHGRAAARRHARAAGHARRHRRRRRPRDRRCAVVSYSHARHLAELAGQGGLAPWLPLAVDGLVAAATCSLLVDRRQGHTGHPLAWAGAALGLAGSFAANVVAVDPTFVDLRHVRWVLAGYVPAALAIAGHLLIRMLGERQ